jgi:sigma-B regulation protein RsbU (phosphoserine phosphatase)
MQIALLESYAVLPLAAGFLLQGLAAFLFFNLYRSPSGKAIKPGLFALSVVAILFLAVSNVLAFVIPSVFVYSSGVLAASAVILALAALAPRFVPVEAAPEPEPEHVADEEPGEDPLIGIAQRFLQHVSESLAGEVNLVRLLDFVNESMIENTAADGGVVFLTDDFEDVIAAKSYSGKFPPPYKLPGDLPHKAVRVETNFRYAQFALGETIFGEVAASGKSQLIPNGAADDRIYVNEPEDFLKPGSYIVVPLMVKDRVVGVAGLARLPEREPFDEENFRIANALSLYAGAAINNVYSVQEILEHADLEREASIASKIQKTLHPKRLPDLPEVGFGSFFTATKGVCGDYYDIILARRDRIAVVVADVAGKGIQSSLVMSMLRSILHLVTNTTKSAGVILDWINKGITGKIDMDHYATLSFLSYSPADHSVEYASAGHQPLLIWREAGKKIEVVRQNTDPIGVERGSKYPELKLTVQKGDIIIFFTDGLIEALNQEGRQYGVESLSRVIAQSSSLTAKEIATEVKHNIQAFVGSAGLHDDQTLVVMKIKA